MQIVKHRLFRMNRNLTIIEEKNKVFVDTVCSFLMNAYRKDKKNIFNILINKLKYKNSESCTFHNNFFKKIQKKVSFNLHGVLFEIYNNKQNKYDNDYDYKYDVMVTDLENQHWTFRIYNENQVKLIHCWIHKVDMKMLINHYKDSSCFSHLLIKDLNSSLGNFDTEKEEYEMLELVHEIDKNIFDPNKIKFNQQIFIDYLKNGNAV